MTGELTGPFDVQRAVDHAFENIRQRAGTPVVAAVVQDFRAWMRDEHIPCLERQLEQARQYLAELEELS